MANLGKKQWKISCPVQSKLDAGLYGENKSKHAEMETPFSRLKHGISTEMTARETANESRNA